MNAKVIFAVTTLIAASSAHAQTMCVFDLLGAQGDSYALMKDYALAAKQWGADIALKPYPDERLAVEDFKAGQCDAVALTGIRVHPFNSFVASIDAIGSVPNNMAAKTIITLMANPKLAPDMVYKNYEVAGVTSYGPAYIMIRDRKINSLIKAAGIKFGVYDYDKAEALMVEKMGGQPVASDLMNIGGKFNNGQIDALGMPAIGFRPLELAKGLGTKGGIFRFPVVHVTYDIIIHQNKFPEGYGQKSRTWTVGLINRTFEATNRIEKSIDPKYWEELPANDKLGYIKLMREARMSMTNQGFYNPKMMGLLKKVRCALDPSSFECSLTGE
jgi:hypothetical protein